MFRVGVADLTGRPAGHAGERPADRHRRADRRTRDAARLAADHRAIRRAELRGGGGAARGEHLRGRLRQARRHGARLLPRIWISCSCTTRAGNGRRRAAARPIDNQVFFVRLAQRIVHLLTMHSAAGRLYEVDVRLRPERQGRHAGHQHRGLRRVSARRRPGPGSTRRCCTRARWPARPSCARASRRCAWRCWPTTCGATTCARRCAACASACAASCRAAMHVQLRYQAGRRRDRRHRVPGAVLGAAVGARLSAGGAVRGHHPAAGVSRLGGPGAAGERRRADRGLPRLPRARPTGCPWQGRSRSCRWNSSGTCAPP